MNKIGYYPVRGEGFRWKEEADKDGAAKTSFVMGGEWGMGQEVLLDGRYGEMPLGGQVFNSG